VQLLSGSRAKTSKVQEELHYKDYVDVPPPVVKDEDDGWARRGLPTDNKSVLTRVLVGRPGLDSGTLGLRGICQQLRRVGLVVHVVCFQGITLPNRYVAPPSIEQPSSLK